MNSQFLEPDARPLAAILFREGRDVSTIEAVLTALLGPIKAKTPHRSFDHSAYYASEMGDSLVKYYLVFAATIQPMDIVSIKHETSRIEQKLAEEHDGVVGRVYNIDPGYFTHAQFILATHKNYSHRVPLGQGVYAELTYLNQGKEWVSLPWTYPDYNLNEVRRFFIEQRNIFLKETKDQRSATSSRVHMWQKMKSSVANK